MKFHKYSIVLVGAMIWSNHMVASAQNVNELFFDEARVSFNRANVADDNTENGNGFGAGLYHSFLSQKKVNLIFGLEYNHTSQFKKNMYEGHYANSTDLTYKMNTFTVPVGIRINFGDYFRIFVETGGYGDIMMLSKKTGTMHTYFPDANDQPQNKDYPIDEKANLDNAIGLYGSLGVRIPLPSFELVIKPEYRYGLSSLYAYKDEIYNHYWRISVGVKMK